jgi:hypothetical protein
MRRHLYSISSQPQRDWNPSGNTLGNAESSLRDASVIDPMGLTTLIMPADNGHRI